MKQLIPMDTYGVFADTRDTARVNNCRNIFNLKEIDELVHQAISNSYKNLDVALKFVDEAFSELNCPWIENCVRETVIRWFINSQPEEKDVYSWFRHEYKKKLGSDWEIVELKSNKNHKPDFWLSNGNTRMPVECKLHKFDEKALIQLQRYMTFYNCENGIAVANQLTVDLPHNISFVKFDIVELEGL